MSSLRERAVGFEHEASITDPFCREMCEDFHLSDPHDVTSLAHAAVKTDAVLQVKGDFWMPNGGRIYADAVSLEFCTPESLPHLAGRYALAGEQFLLAAAERVFKQRGVPAKDAQLQLATVQLSAVAAAGLTCGFHENYQQLAASASYPEEFLRTIMMMRYPWAGNAGIFNFDDSKQALRPSPMQKLVYNTDSANKKEIGLGLDTGRIELRHADYPITPFNLRNRAPFTSAVLRLAEHRVFDIRDFMLHGMEKSRLPMAIRTDFDLARLYEFGPDKKEMTALHFQSWLCDSVLQAFAQDLPDYERSAIEEVGELCDVIEQNPEALHIESHYSIVHKLVERRQKKFGDEGAHAIATLGRSSVRGGLGIVDWIRAKDATMISPETVEVAMYVPPSEAAQRRVEFCKNQHIVNQNRESSGLEPYELKVEWHKGLVVSDDPEVSVQSELFHEMGQIL